MLKLVQDILPSRAALTWLAVANLDRKQSLDQVSTVLTSPINAFAWLTSWTCKQESAVLQIENMCVRLRQAASWYRDARLQKGEQLSWRRFLHGNTHSRQPLSSLLSEAVVKFGDLLIGHLHAAPPAFDG